MGDFIPGFHSYSLENPVSASLHSKSNTFSLDSLLKEAACSAQVYLNDNEDSLSESSVELKANIVEDNVKSFVALNLFQDSCSLKSSILPSHHRDILENVQNKIGYQVNYFSFESETELNEVKLICKVCCKTLHVEQVEEHVLDQEHLCNLVERYNSNVSATAVIKKNRKLKVSNTSKFSKDVHKFSNPKVARRKNIINAKSNFVPLFSAQTKLKKSCSASTEFLSKCSKKVVQDLTEKLKDYMNYFEPHETRWNKSCFTCKMCRMSFSSKNARLHIYSSTHLHNLRQSLSVVEFETSNARNKKIVKDLIFRFNNKLYFFQLIRDNELNELYFICKVCTLVLLPGCLESHIYALEHSKSVQENPVVLNFDSLNNCNKQKVRELKDAIQIHRIKDFVYRIGTEDLRFYCKCCQLTLIPENVKDHVKTSDHSRAVKVVESSLKSQTFVNDRINNAIVPPKPTFNSLQVAPFSETEDENLTIVGFYSLTPTNKAIVETLEHEIDSELMYFDLLQTNDTKELYFRCTLCDITLKPSLVLNHVMCSGHMKSWELNVHFEDFLSLEDSLKKVLRKLFFEVGSKLSAFCLAPDMDSRSLRFTCTFCNITVDSDFVVNHLQKKKHKARTGEDESEDYTATISKDSLQQYASNNDVNSKLNNHQVVKITDPLLLGVDSSATLSDFPGIMPDLNVEGALRESKLLLSDCNHQDGSNEICFVCHNCSTTICFKSAENNGLHKQTAEKFFINCCERSVEAVLLNRKNRKVSSSNAADPKTSLMTLDGRSVSSFGSNETRLCPTQTASRKNSSESEICYSDKELLKSLIDKIGIKMNNFDYMLTAGSNELRVKCKFCSVMMRPESVEEHINCGSHLVNAQLSNVSSLSFESLNDHNKKIMRKLFKKIGSEINHFDVKVAVNFICKICNGQVSAETIPDHLCSEEHLKLLGRGSQNLFAESSQASNNGSYVFLEKITHDHMSSTDSPALTPSAPCHNIEDLNLRFSTSACDTLTHPEFGSTSGHNKYFSSVDKTIKRTASSTAASGKLQVDSKVFNSILFAKPAEKCYHPEKLEQNLLVDPQHKFTSITATEQQSHDLRGLLGSSDYLKSVGKAQNYVLTTGVLHIEVKSMVQNSSLPLAGNCSSKSKQVKSTASDRIVQNAHIDDFTSRTASEKFKVGSKVSNTVLSAKPAEKSYGHKEFQQIPLVNNPCDKLDPAVVISEKSKILGLPSASNDFAHTPKVQTVLSAAELCTLEFPQFESLRLTCAACKDILQINIEDIANHVNSEGHKIKLKLPPVNSNVTNLRDYNKKIVELFAGDINHKLNNFDTLYEMPQKELCFYCKFCCSTIRAEALERHVTYVHLNNMTEKCEINRSDSSIEELNQVSRLFLCQVCNFKTYDEGVTQHLNSERHLQLSKIRADSLRFQSFSAYKGKIISMLCCDPFIKASDFDFFFETGSNKLHLYCKPCKILLQPESLLQHFKTTDTHSKDVRVSTSSQKSTQNSSKCSLM